MSVLNHLTNTASDLLTRGPLASDVEKSVATLQSRLNSYFSATSIREHFRFGSSKRGTSLPRKADQYSDVDYMVVFYGDTDARPQTLLDRLKRFVEEKYSSSEVKQSHPTIVLTLNHIQFELVPAVRTGNLSYGSLNIPSSASYYGNWQTTDPSAADAALEQHNKDHSFNSKPLVRLLKYWNCQADPYTRPFSSYELEKLLQGIPYWPRSNLKDYFYGAVDGLSLPWDAAQTKKDKLDRLKAIINEVRDYERRDMPVNAEVSLKKAIPVFV